MKTQRQVNVSLISPGELVETIHYGPYSHYWWHLLPNFNKDNEDNKETAYFSIRVSQKSKVTLNEHEFIVTVVVGDKENNNFLPGYLCHCRNIIKVANDLTNAIFEVYFKIFETKTHYSEIQIMETSYTLEIYQNQECKRIIKDESPINIWKNLGLIKKFNGNQLFGIDNNMIQSLNQKQKAPTCSPREWEDYSIMLLLFNYHLKRRTITDIDWHQLFVKWKKQVSPLIELNNELQEIYSEDYQFSSRELEADPKQDSALLAQLYQMGILANNSIQTFWQCFNQALNDNKKNYDGKRRILSIISDDFTYDKLQENLGVGQHTIFESRKYARINSYRAPVLDKPIFYRTKLTSEQLQQFELFFSTKKHVNMSSYKTDNKSGLPENLGGLCSECNECGYQVFANIEELININITNLLLWNELIDAAQNLRRYLRRDYPKQLNVSQDGIAIHDSCLTHCLRYAFGDCEATHSNTCSNCKNLFIFFKNLKKYLPLDQHENLDNYQKQLIAFMSHHTRKIYLNVQLSATLSQLDYDEALIIVNYKMRINSKKVREMKDE
ncbi:hypothetical protein GLOIN_2v1483553 [Rhizophagus clarus]|uniref:Uncharacterized protein n=1 Tax=Rhizophagus clarus TaxID=94130 RepID=A0A8H3QEI4_9GLOM|nr:hypothetical protein GLOIN_2v1483553 [Rhizophagus clarus]